MRIFGRGKCVPTETVVAYACRSRAAGKFAVVAGKKVGGAVSRNRAKRVLRAAFREISSEYSLKKKTDIIFVARAKTTKVKMQAVKADMEKALSALGVLL